MSVIKSLLDFIVRLKSVEKISEKCVIFARKYKQVNSEANESRRQAVSDGVKSVLSALYTTYKIQIKDKDFSFMNSGIFILDDTDIGQLYLTAIDEEEDSNKINKINNGLLALFLHVMSDDDKKEVNDKFSKKKEEPVNAAASIQSLLAKNADVLKEAEKDQSKIPQAVQSILTNNSGEMMGIITNVLSSLGMNPENLNMQSKKTVKKNVKRVNTKKPK